MKTGSKYTLLTYSLVDPYFCIDSAGLTNAGTNTFVNDFLTNDLLYDLIFGSSSPGSLFCLKCTCKTAQAAVDSYFGRAFNINRHLLRFFDNPQDFRSLQARTATLISGSNALQFFNRTIYADSDLDLYTFYEHRLEVGQWLIQNGFAFRPTSKQNANFEVASRNSNRYGGLEPVDELLKYHTEGVSSVFTFTKTPHEGEAELKVQVVVASLAPMAVVLNFHSSEPSILLTSLIIALSNGPILAVVLNVISWDRAYSLYPRATFEDHKSLYLRPDYTEDETEPLIIAKYEERGWDFDTGRSTLEKHDRAFSSVARWIGDSLSWVIKLDLAGVMPPPPANDFSPPLSRDPCCFTSWWMTPQHPYRSYPPSRPTRGIHSSKFLSYNYVSLFDLASPMLFPICQSFRRAGPQRDQLVAGRH